MDQAEIARRVQERFGDRVLATGESCGQHHVTVGPESLRGVLMFLRDEVNMNILTDLGGVDYLGYPEPDDAVEPEDDTPTYGGRAWRYEVAYQMYSMADNVRFRVKVAVRDDTVPVPSVWDLWRMANWMEREVFDMFGVRFDGHPNLRRILCHDQFEGHALRKDYPINKRQKLASPVEHLLTDDPEWA